MRRTVFSVVLLCVPSMCFGARFGEGNPLGNRELLAHTYASFVRPYLVAYSAPSEVSCCGTGSSETTTTTVDFPVDIPAGTVRRYRIIHYFGFIRTSGSNTIVRLYVGTSPNVLLHTLESTSIVTFGEGMFDLMVTIYRVAPLSYSFYVGGTSIVNSSTQPTLVSVATAYIGTFSIPDFVITAQMVGGTSGNTFIARDTMVYVEDFNTY